MRQPQSKPESTTPSARGAARKASDIFVRCLEAEGITHIFGVPGEENSDFRKVLAICGDAGFLMNVQDLETAVRLKMNMAK